jgi:hypothetical protein
MLIVIALAIVVSSLMAALSVIATRPRSVMGGMMRALAVSDLERLIIAQAHRRHDAQERKGGKNVEHRGRHLLAQAGKCVSC